MIQRLGIMGGMFDPVHRGHIDVALTAQRTLRLEQVRLVPCARPNHRREASAPGVHRLRMLELASANHPGLRADDRELQRSGVSYTVDTLRSFADEYPRAALVFIQGWDSFMSLPRWHRWREILDHAHICAVSRPGERLPQPGSEDPDEKALLRLLEDCRVTDVDALFSRRHGHVYVLDAPQWDVASSELRARFREGAGPSDGKGAELDPAVAAYIMTHRLY